MEEKLLKISEAAEQLGVSIDTLRRWDESGKLVAIKKEGGTHRYYREKDIEIFASDIFKLALDWISEGIEFPGIFYCKTSDVFQARLTKMQDLLMSNENTKDIFSLIVSVAGEIGNNSYDHNIGKWPDTQGIFFGFDVNKKQIVLADRGVGILETLKMVRPQLKNHQEALWVGFTEVVSGRQPEARGNGLKYVRRVISKNPINLLFQTGDAKLTLNANSPDLNIETAKENLRGCLALIKY